LLNCQVLSYFEHHLRMRMRMRMRVETEDSELPDELIELVLSELHIGLEYISKRAIHVQKYCMRQPRVLYMGLNTSLQ
jgi:hypothetical protein